MELLQARQIYNDFVLRRVTQGMIFFGRADNQIHDVRETAATAAAFAHGVIDFRRYDELPTVFVKKLDDDVLDFLVRDVIAAADEHFR
jgi:hypothetical protein